MKIALAFILITSCSVFKSKGPAEGKKTFSYTDVSGSYRLIREVKHLDKKVVVRNQLINSSAGNAKVVEKSITVTELGSVKEKGKRLLAARPGASEFMVWLEGKRYQVNMKLVPEKKSLRISMESPETKWQGTKDYPVPKGRLFCFYSQLPECLFYAQLLETAHADEKEEFGFYVVWDNFPFVQEQLTGVGADLFSPATVKFDGEIKKRFRYIIEVDGQVILYHFTSSYELEKISWISQGITVVPPGEEVNDIENQ